MAVASSYLARLGPKGIVTVLESNTARHSIGDPNKSKYNWYLYYEAQAEMNVCACILQSPESIAKVWEDEQLSREENARAVLSVHEESLRPEVKKD